MKEDAMNVELQRELAEKADGVLPCFPREGLAISVGDGWIALGDDQRREYTRASRVYKRQAIRIFQRGRRWILRVYKLSKDSRQNSTRRSWTLLEGTHLLIYSSGELRCHKQTTWPKVERPLFPRGGMEVIVEDKHLYVTWENKHCRTGREFTGYFTRQDILIWRKKRKCWQISVTPVDPKAPSQTMYLGNGRYHLSEVDGKIRCKSLKRDPDDGDYRLFKGRKFKQRYVRAHEKRVKRTLCLI
jgi:hypothetical protein